MKYLRSNEPIRTVSHSLAARSWSQRSTNPTRAASVTSSFPARSRSRRRTHQNLDRALTSSKAQSFMRKTSGSGFASVGRCRPTTWNWRYCGSARARVSPLWSFTLTPARDATPRAKETNGEKHHANHSIVSLARTARLARHHAHAIRNPPSRRKTPNEALSPRAAPTPLASSARRAPRAHHARHRSHRARQRVHVLCTEPSLAPRKGGARARARALNRVAAGLRMSDHLDPLLVFRPMFPRVRFMSARRDRAVAS